MPVFFTNTTKIPIPEAQLVVLIEHVLNKEKKSCREISAVYCGDRFIQRINKAYLSHDYPTDTISFPYSQGNAVEGEFYISLHTIKRNARRFNVSFQDELFRVTIHSVLHLIGYNDYTPEEKKVMTDKEDEYLASISGIVQ